jgi:hypothetical protein
VQLEIVEIILLLNPRYIKAFTEVRLWDADASTWRRIDILLVDASGNVDVIEIKKPMGKPIMLPARYRDHHLPMRDLVGAMGHGYSLPEASEPVGAGWRGLHDPVVENRPTSGL